MPRPACTDRPGSRAGGSPTRARHAARRTRLRRTTATGSAGSIALYLSELSASKSGLFPALGEWPSREDEFLAGWFNDPAATPFVILADGQRAGFALVARPPAFPRRTADFRMAEFFVVDAARRRGVGASAAHAAVHALRRPLGSGRGRVQPPGARVLAPRDRPPHRRPLHGDARGRRGLPPLRTTSACRPVSRAQALRRPAEPVTLPERPRVAAAASRACHFLRRAGRHQAARRRGRPPARGRSPSRRS